MLKLLFLGTVFLFVLAGPIAALRQPWAIRLWRRLKLLLVAYIVTIVIIAVVRLISNWDQIYG